MTALVGGIAVVPLVAMGQPAWAVLVGALVVVAGWWLSPASPLPKPESVSHWEAQQRHVREDSVIIYWRPGCPACLRLRLALWRHLERASLVDIWADDEAAAFVRDVNGGAETVPTVIFGNGDVMVNPPPADVAEALRG